MSEKNKPNIPETYLIGEQFEKYVRNNIFTKDNFILVEKTHSYQDNFNDFIESTKNPDFKFRDRLINKEFYVEAKFRTYTCQDKINLFKNYEQLNRYHEFNKILPVFIILGFGGSPQKPDFLSLFPVREANYLMIFQSIIIKYELSQDFSLTSKNLWSLA